MADTFLGRALVHLLLVLGALIEVISHGLLLLMRLVLLFWVKVVIVRLLLLEVVIMLLLLWLLLLCRSHHVCRILEHLVRQIELAFLVYVIGLSALTDVYVP